MKLEVTKYYNNLKNKWSLQIWCHKADYLYTLENMWHWDNWYNWPTLIEDKDASNTFSSRLWRYRCRARHSHQSAAQEAHFVVVAPWCVRTVGATQARTHIASSGVRGFVWEFVGVDGPALDVARYGAVSREVGHVLSIFQKFNFLQGWEGWLDFTGIIVEPDRKDAVEFPTSWADNASLHVWMIVYFTPLLK